MGPDGSQPQGLCCAGGTGARSPPLSPPRSAVPGDRDGAVVLSSHPPRDKQSRGGGGGRGCHAVSSPRGTARGVFGCLLLAAVLVTFCPCHLPLSTENSPEVEEAAGRSRGSAPGKGQGGGDSLAPPALPPTSSGHSHATPCTRSLLSPSHWWQLRDRNSSFHPQIALHKAPNGGHSFSTAFQWHLCLKAGGSLPSGTPAAGGKEREGKCPWAAASPPLGLHLLHPEVF